MIYLDIIIDYLIKICITSIEDKTYFIIKDFSINISKVYQY